MNSKSDSFRLFQILFLVVGLAMFTTVIPEAMILLGTRKKFGGSYKNERGKTFIVVRWREEGGGGRVESEIIISFCIKKRQ